MGSASALNSLLSASSSAPINLSSVLAAALGATSPGIDVTSAVNSAVTCARAPEQAWQAEQSTLQSQKDALSQIQLDARTLSSDIQSLNDLTGPLSARIVSSSNSGLVSASAASGSVTGDHLVVVNSLATTASWVSRIFDSSSSALPADSFTVKTGSGASTTIRTDGTESLTDVANRVNDENLGLLASVVTDAGGARLALVADASGGAGNFTVSANGSSGFRFTQAVAAQNASLTVDGIPMSSASNTVSGAIPGLTINLLSVDPKVEVSLGVTPDTSEAANAINQFVTDYNTVISELTTQFTFDGTSEGVLSGDTTVRNLQRTMLDALNYTQAPASGTTTIPNLTSLGIDVGNDGKLTVNGSALDNALQNNFVDTQSFFQGSALDGFANHLNSQLTSFLSPGDGAFTIDLHNMDSEFTELQKNVADFETYYIEPLKAQMQKEYSQAEIMLQQLPLQMQQINTELGLNNTKN